MNWFALVTAPIWVLSAIQEFFWRGNIKLGIISLSFAVANACIGTLGQ